MRADKATVRKDMVAFLRSNRVQLMQRIKAHNSLVFKLNLPQKLFVRVPR